MLDILACASVFLYLCSMNSEIKSSSPNFDRIDPRTCLNAKLRKLHRIINAAYMSNLKPFGLRGSMLSILFIIGKRPGVNQKAIADILILDQSTMSRDLKKLVEKGWIDFFKGGKDARYKQLQLTNAGVELLEKVTPVWERMHHSVEEILGKHNIQQIDVITIAISKHVDEIKMNNS
ncbi:MAG: DNA-binding MarR family transcriptional regulator [Saprospiraceae bacterium]